MAYGGDYMYGNLDDCIYISGYHGATAGGFAGRMAYGMAGLNETQVSAMVDLYFESSPNGKVTIGNYTPRGRKRRDLRSKRRGPVLSIQLGGTRIYFPDASYYRGTVTIQRDKATLRCHCDPDTDRKSAQRTKVVWSAAS